MSTASQKAPFGTDSGSFFVPFLEAPKKAPKNQHKRSIWRLWRANDPQSDPQSSPIGGQNPSKIITKSSLSRRGRQPATFDLKKLFWRGPPPKRHRKSAEKRTNFDGILAEYGYSVLLQNKKMAGVPPCILYLLGCRKSGKVQEK